MIPIWYLALLAAVLIGVVALAIAEVVSERAWHDGEER